MEPNLVFVNGMYLQGSQYRQGSRAMADDVCL